MWDRGGPPSEYQSGSEIEAYLQEMVKRDPWFELGSFLHEAQGVFVDVTRNWSEMDADDSRPYMLPELFDAHREGIEAMRSKELRPVVENLNVIDVRLVGAWLEDAWDCLLVRFTASSTDYKLNKRGKKIGDSEERTWVEEWTFSKSMSDLTPALVPPGAHCPNCGAPGEGTVRCPYCGQLRTSGRSFRDVWKAASIEELYTR